MSPRSSGPQGKLSYQDREFLLSFRYSKPRFAALRKLGIARFDKSQKKWRIPLQYLPQLETHPLFSQRHIKYDFDVKAVATELEDLRNDVDSARERVAADPFSVSESDIALLEIDVVFRLARRGSSLRAFLRSGSKARGNLEKISGVQHLPSENCYFFPVEHLASFLQNLRNRNLSFAVEEQAAKYLVLGAKVRRRVIHDGECVASEDLEYAALHPYVVQVFEGKTTTFCLKCYTAEQLRKLVPDVTDYHLRRRHVAALSVDALVRMIYASRSANQTLWLSSEAQQAMDHARPGYESRLDHLSESIPDYYLGAIELEACWTTSHVGEAVLLLSDRLIQSHFASEKPWGVLKAKTAEWGDGHCGIAVRDSQVLEFFAHIEQLFTARQLPSPRVTQSFAALKRELEGRRALWLRTRQFQEMSDVELDIPDSDLPAHLFAHQRVAVRWLSENPQALLGDDMGLGKTLSILAYFEMLLKSMAAGLLVVVCPNSLTRNWLREVERWVPQRRAILLPESKTQRSECLEALEWDSADVDILVTNFETLRLDYVFPAVESIANQRYTLLCVDESQRAKNPQSKTFEALKHVAESSERRVLLSGTPTPRDITDIWAQMRLLDDGLRLGTNYFDWLHEIAELGNQYSEYAVKKLIPERVEESVHRVQEILLRRRKEDVLDLPEKLFSVRDIKLTGSQAKRYAEVCDELLLRVSSTSGKTFVREIDSILEEYLRAVQIASNPRLVDENWEGEPAKFIELDELVREIVVERESKLVIWTNYRGNASELAERFAKEGAAELSGAISGTRRTEIVQAFQDTLSNDVRILVAVPAAGGVGLTLTAAQTAVYVDKTWNAEHWLQSIDRLHRIGQRGTVSVISLHSCPVDWLIARSLERKRKDQARLLGDAEQEQCVHYPSRDELITALST